MPSLLLLLNREVSSVIILGVYIIHGYMNCAVPLLSNHYAGKNKNYDDSRNLPEFM